MVPLPPANGNIKLVRPALRAGEVLENLSRLTARLLESGIAALVLALALVAPPAFSESMTSDAYLQELEAQFDALERDIQRRDRINQWGSQTLNPSALIDASDRDPVDVVLRRTTALLADLTESDQIGHAKVESFAARLREYADQGQLPDTGEKAKRYELYVKICQLRREIAFSNTLLSFDRILFLKRHRATFNHMCDQYYGINARPGGGIFELTDPFSTAPRARDLLVDSRVESGRLAGETLTGGSFLSPDLSFDGDHVVFAYVECLGDKEQDFHTDPSRGHWETGRSYHIFSARTDGTELRQLTDGTWNDFDPCWMPDGRIAFISERRGGYLRCGRECPTYTLHDMSPDGSGIRCLSPHETNEWHPSLTHEGQIIYTRWDYVDRHGCVAHQPWITTPDGRDSRAVHGNFSPRKSRADMELDVRAVPDSHKFVATGAPHHGQAFGSLVLIDPRVEDDDGMAPLKRITPEVDFPETQGGAQVYGTPWPLSEKYFLCAYDAGMTPEMGGQGQDVLIGNYGLYLIDAFGNRELLYRDPQISCQNPVPLRSRTTPPVIPSTLPENVANEATVSVLDVYNSRTPWPKGTKITALRVYQVIPMSVPSGNPPHEIGMRLPGEEGADSVTVARHILGTTPVEEDGSAHFVVPANVEIFFQALDEDGLAIQSMRSSTYLKPGEHLSCIGCHESQGTSPGTASHTPIALRRPALPLQEDVDGTRPFSYPRLVQPVLDRKCVTCHEEHDGSAPRLDAEVVADGGKIWYASYHSLAPDYGFWKYGDPHRTRVGKFGARRSRLYWMLRNGHYDVQLDDEEWHRLAVWLDSASVFYGVYEKEGGEAQLRGEIVMPTLE